LKELYREISGQAQKEKHLKAEIERMRAQIDELKTQEEFVRPHAQTLWKERDPNAEQAQRDKRALSRGKLAKGPMFRNKPLGVLKAKIEELVD
jgi:cell division protein FtsB